MKTKTILITLIGLLVVSTLVFHACKKENDPPPELPSNPVPSDESTGISISTLLEWECTDPENDPLTFDIYFGTNNPPSIAETNHNGFTYDPGTLAQSTQYYWKVVAKDDQGNQTDGVIWTFATTGGGTGTFTDPRDGQTYNTIEIGSQTWFAENLNYQSSNSWCYGDNGSNCDIYGRLYTWEAALNACPSGWHLPSDDEWKTMEMALGMSQSQADETGWRGTDEGGKMKETGTTHWTSPNTGATNSSGFTALPGGYRRSSGSFYSLGGSGHWWSSSEGSGASAWLRSLGYGYGQVGRGGYYKAYGRSVRCLKN